MRLLVTFALAGLFVGTAVRGDDPPKPKGSIGIMISAKTGSVVIEDTVPGSPAEKAGLKAGDVIVKINDHKVKEKDATNDDVNEMAKEIFKHEPGTKIKITVKRDNKEKQIEVTVGKPGEFTPKKDKD
jgi:S1-C subfamily serine protease